MIKYRQGYLITSAFFGYAGKCPLPGTNAMARLNSTIAYKISRATSHPEFTGTVDGVRILTQQFTSAVERLIRRDRTKYLWFHRRWKHQPKRVAVGQPSHRLRLDTFGRRDLSLRLATRIIGLPPMYSRMVRSVPGDWPTVYFFKILFGGSDSENRLRLSVR